MSLTYTVDPRIPINPDVSRKDPAHPNNLIRDMQYIQNQAVADAKYDTIPPERVYEAFDSRYSINTYLIVLGSTLVILYGVYTSMVEGGSNSKQSFQFFFFVMVLVAVFLYTTRFIRF
jgi:hypothetical protein